MRNFAPHTLSEPEEKILSIKADTGVNAFARLFDEVTGRMEFSIEENGARAKKTESEILALLHSPDRGLRKAASESLAEGLSTHSHALTYIYNMILADHRSSMKLRRLSHPAQARNLANEIDLEGFDHLVRSVKAAYPVARRYYALKKKLLGLDELFDYDRYAPVGSDETKIPFERCRSIVLEGYRAFSEEAARVAGQFFDRRWIDAEIRPGKQGGGFCCQTTPELHPYILVNYTGTMRDVMTVAHELGHGLHQFLARKAGILESDAPLTLAETASVFGEMLIFERLFEAERDRRKRLALLCGKIDDHFATVFRQIAMTDFELKAHAAGLADGELAGERLSDLWIEANADYYGGSVTLTDAYRHGWKAVPHFVHTPFYCYAYAFAQLFVLCLFEKYREDPARFVPGYLKMLELGGSKKPGEIAAIAKMDLNAPDFWRSGLSFLERYVARAEELCP
jgi:oligoendopeptidase F